MTYRRSFAVSFRIGPFLVVFGAAKRHPTVVSDPIESHRMVLTAIRSGLALRLQ